MGNSTAKAGKGKHDDLVGLYGQAGSNVRGDQLNFCYKHLFDITNTTLKLPPRRLYSWRTPRDQPDI